ncbi:MAG: methyltransferase domain-containing protein [Pseudomonadota bacterium]
MSDRETVAVYDAQVGDYAKLVRDDRPDQDLRRFMDAVPPSGRVLDLGCGTGNSAYQMAVAGFDVVATDASGEMVTHARERYKIDARQATFDDLSEENTYDGVWANFSLLHAERRHFPSHLTSVRRALKTDGIFHIGMKLGSGEHRDGIGRFYCYYSEQDLSAHLQHARFDILHRRKGETKGLAGTVDPFTVILCRARD